jgi:predicted transport protein
MSDIKLFRTLPNSVEELTPKSAKLEKELQKQIETNMDTFLSIRFLATEFSTSNGGRIDSLGLDENGCPVIIEYKRHSNENVINQGLFYLDWLLDHKADFQLLVMSKLGNDMATTIEWFGARLICIASDFNRYDEYAIKQIDRNIELMRYKYFSDDLLLLELVNTQVSSKPADLINNAAEKLPETKKNQAYDWTLDKAKSQSSTELMSLFNEICSYVESLSDDVTRKDLKLYTAFKRIKNIACVSLVPNKDPRVVMWLKLNPDNVHLEKGFTKDVRNIGHWGTGDLEVEVRDAEQLERAKQLLLKSFEEA